MFRKILIANRGEIAVRILRACRELGIRTAVVFSEADRKSLHVRLADEAYPIGPAASRESYLRIDKIMDVVRRTGCDAIHPGYGFLAENAALPRACVEAGITFIGPSAEAMEALGAKTSGRQLARRADVPTVPGTNDAIDDPQHAQELARGMGYPVLLKAVAGGGGKGMRLVTSESEFAAAFREASSEALNAFGDASVYLEKYLEKPRHIEIQILADAHGRDHVTPEDVHHLFLPVLGHRLLLSASFLAESRGLGRDTALGIIKDRCLALAPAPAPDWVSASAPPTAG